MTEPYGIVEVTPDTPAWLEERRSSVGASEVAAVMGLSAYGVTPLDVYKSKLGVDRPFDPLLSFIGHESEHIIHKWVEEFSGLDVALEPGFMARSVEWPFLHASFDRVTSRPFTTFQFKTAHQYAGHHWDEGIPTDIRVQVQAEMAVAGTPRAAVVVWIGGREFRHFWEPRDDRFIQEHMIPTVMRFWDANVRAKVPPDPATLAEAVEAWPAVRDKVIEVDEDVADKVGMWAIAKADEKAAAEEADRLRKEILDVAQTADTLVFDGRKIATLREQAGRVSFNRALFDADNPGLYDRYVMQGAPFRVLRTIKQKETAK